MTRDEADRLIREISGRYSSRPISLERGHYPPFALVAWEDRSRFLQYIEAVIDDFVDAVPVVTHPTSVPPIAKKRKASR